jgi:hypothetical protein
MPSINMDNGVRAEDLEAAIAAENGTAPPKSTPAPAATPKATKTTTKKTEV